MNKILKSYAIGLQLWFVNTIIAHIPSTHLRLFFLKMLGLKALGTIRLYPGIHIRRPKGIIIGQGASIGPKVLLDGRCGLTIGQSAVIAYEAIIWSLNHDYNDPNFCGKGAPVSIGDYAWICSRSIILPGVNIGEGAVVASGAIVTKDVPPYTVVAGIPAKIISERKCHKYNYGCYSLKEEHIY